MRKVLFALAACVLCAAPLKAQAVQAEPATPAPAAASAPRAHQDARTTPAPSLYPTTDEIRQQVAQVEAERVQGKKAAIPNDFLYLVAAIVVGVVIAALLLD
jgi:hypothetical protein